MSSPFFDRDKPTTLKPERHQGTPKKRIKKQISRAFLAKIQNKVNWHAHVEADGMIKGNIL